MDGHGWVYIAWRNQADEGNIPQYLSTVGSLPPMWPHGMVTGRVMPSSKCQTQPYQVKCLVGVLEAQQHVLQDGQSPLSHDGVQQFGKDLVGEEKSK